MRLDRCRPWGYLPDVVPDPDALFLGVQAEVQWTDQMRARRTASMGRPYNYAGASYPEAPWHPAVREVAESLCDVVGFELWMSQALQHAHKHGIRREPGAGMRISLTFRRIVKESPVVDRPAWGSSDGLPEGGLK